MSALDIVQSQDVSCPVAFPGSWSLPRGQSLSPQPLESEEVSPGGGGGRYFAGSNKGTPKSQSPDASVLPGTGGFHPGYQHISFALSHHQLLGLSPLVTLVLREDPQED